MNPATCQWVYLCRFPFHISPMLPYVCFAFIIFHFTMFTDEYLFSLYRGVRGEMKLWNSELRLTGFQFDFWWLNSETLLKVWVLLFVKPGSGWSNNWEVNFFWLHKDRLLHTSRYYVMILKPSDIRSTPRSIRSIEIARFSSDCWYTHVTNYAINI